MKDTEKLTGYELFKGITAGEIAKLLTCMNAAEKTYSKNEIITLEDDEVRFVGLVLGGAVNMVKEDLWGEETLITFIREGEIFGETFALQKRQNSYVTFIAAEETTILFLPADQIIHTCSACCGFHQTLTTNMFNLVGKKGVMLMEKIEISSRASLREKILSYLSILAQKQGKTDVVSPLNRTRMAEYLGVNRSAMTRELSSMKKEGLIDFNKNVYMVYVDER